MAITTSAKRAIRNAERRRIFNIRRTDTMRETLKDFRKLVAEGHHAEAEKKLPLLYKALDKAAKRGVIKKNTAARKKSRATAFLRKTSKKTSK
ncbi:MAG: 30S ribosomal protein S20 [Candidatus Lloydbacteria bacterium RIFCSPHIGHO2_02_FULL_54_17]|uniref:Small ribosomal subunit protein bS20 n=1 Tax=Candidatus Lloydbacteria bacterium RIFCSPHIGHO2_02_FULL_54_17 TaxID=1798664 RepID=A0A1G2DHG7_9BACT|nr:MAG: 30S ribosomal protein S20 [Candidatus Lloydbacteria bacterium RIFCSPHIGHO2_01_FULL_54_11]OGZ13016.1 MAG: 30S ribosomal protein S20 [Candidatus Lloydbacteria bacterium RIFCSPHIGHO2_02_FULL_54_17]OGZ15118.1 MAG: 30S ribosomal protein S20 [Candidatus Lloydbacteria bacterium RIFCSPLOWO2_02_FULL_54_12]OGZ15251.1 MAG: 30S ribosomal protein S20 [Candidatus Lloydbacteria bacterium RIFCSPLOWO2_01_FULL_54_18]